MTQHPDPADAARVQPALKVPESKINPKEPWRDDVLERKEIADRLTSIVRGQGAPFVISIDGRWGTGKTFLLKRWAQGLQNQGFEAIYFNAWEDDFSKDPLLAIIGQLAEHFGEGLLRQMAVGVADAALNILTNRLVGMKFDDLTAETLLDGYRDQQATQRAVRERLRELGAKVREDKNQPLVFVIDELDRCRPTFAIELLERVKHIFDVPNIVFVFGINRGELVKSLESVYGEIDTGTYLRRFFDMEFTLPEPDPGRFCEHLLRGYGLEALLARQYEGDGDLEQAIRVLPFILGTMGLSLRDIDYCVRLLALAAHDRQAEPAGPPELLATLVALKIANQELYRAFVAGTARGAEVITYVNTRRLSDTEGTPYRSRGQVGDIERVEAALYAADSYGTVSRQIDALMEGWQLDEPQYLAEHHRRLNRQTDDEKHELRQLRNWVVAERNSSGSSLAAIARRIDVYGKLFHGFIGR